MIPVDTKGERTLVSTLLEQGIHVLKVGRFADLPCEITFFFGRSHFETLAHLLGIDPEAVREKLLEVLSQRAEEAKDGRIRQLLRETLDRLP